MNYQIEDNNKKYGSSVDDKVKKRPNEANEESKKIILRIRTNISISSKVYRFTTLVQY